MAAGEDGWHRARLEGVAAGAAYAFRREDGALVPDPASRANPWDVHGPSAVVDPRAFEWSDDAWRGRPWHEAVVYELHVGTFTAEGTVRPALERLDHLADCGATAIQGMPGGELPGA